MRDEQGLKRQCRLERSHDKAPLFKAARPHRDCVGEANAHTFERKIADGFGILRLNRNPEFDTSIDAEPHELALNGILRRQRDKGMT